MSRRTWAVESEIFWRLATHCILWTGCPLTAPADSDLVHHIYTSGSTGTPKAVSVTHRALRSYTTEKLRIHRIDSASRVLLCSAHTWDPCIGDIASTLAAGAVLCVVPRAYLVNSLADAIFETAASHVMVTPSLWSLVASQ